MSLLSDGRGYVAFARRTRREAQENGAGNGASRPGHRTCPRCSHHWVDGGAVSSGLEWPGEAVDHLCEMRVVLPPEEPTIRGVVEAAARHGSGSVEDAASRLNVARRTLGRRLREAGLPPASWWCGLAWCAGAAELMLRYGRTANEAAGRIGLSGQPGLNRAAHRRLDTDLMGLRALPKPVPRSLAERWLDVCIEGLS